MTCTRLRVALVFLNEELSMHTNWALFAMGKYFSARQGELLDDKLKRFRSSTLDTRIQLVDRVNQLEDDLSRTLLLLQALTETCIAKGVLTREELAAMAEQVDLSDGVADGKLDLQTIRPPVVDGPVIETTTEEYLQKLEDEGEETLG
jgi:hypothetical protein